VLFRVRAVDGLAFFASGAGGFKRFANGDRVGGDQGIIYSFDTTTIPGFSDGTTYVRGAVGFDADTRDSPFGGATGIVVRGVFDYTHGIDRTDSASYERLSGMVGLPINLWARTHILWLSAATSLAWPNGSDQVPFSELPTLGGPNDLRGFRFQDFRDYTAFWATAEYRWPVWMWVDGAIFVDYGGVFGKNYVAFGATRMQPDVGLALRLMTSNRYFVRANIGYGFGEGVNFSLSGTAP
jgi:outer membrane protein assembly factor BamA